MVHIKKNGLVAYSIITYDNSKISKFQDKISEIISSSNYDVFGLDIDISFPKKPFKKWIGF